MNKIRFAVDLGTTFIDTCFIDASDGTVISKDSFKNRQSLYGSDVINRIKNSDLHDNLKKMKSLVIEDIKLSVRRQLDALKKNAGIIDKIIISGNTTMISILLEMKLSSLGIAPFTTLLKDNVVRSSKELFGDDFALDCDVILTGCAGAFIGGDILTGIIYAESIKEGSFLGKSRSLLIDLGTNGEMVLNVDNVLYATSTACGPAFENSTRRQGVYASNTIDAIVLGVKTGNVSRTGVLKEAYIEKGLNINGVTLTMDILRAILLAKSAIYSGIISLCKEASVEPEDIENIYIAGGFGFYLNIENAIYIGLIPEEFRGRIEIIGNSSLKGDCLILQNEMLLDKVSRLTKGKINILQLANDENYKKKFIENMIFGVA